MAKSAAKPARRGEGPLDTVLAPLVSLIVVASAMLRRSRTEPGPAARPAPPPEPDRAGDEPAAGGLRARLERLGKRVPPLGLALAVQRRVGDVKGGNVAAAVTLQAFLSLFPLILVVVAVVGFLSASGTGDVAGRIISSLGLSGEAARAVEGAVGTAERSRQAASVVGLAGLLWSGLGLVNAIQYALNQVWQVEERGIKDKAIGLGWLLGSALLLVAGAAVTTAMGWLPGFLSPFAVLVALAVNFGLWLWSFRVLPNRRVPWRALVPGAVLGAVGLEVLKVVGGYYVPRVVASSSELYGSLGVVFAILAWLLLLGRLVVYASALNVVLWEREHGTVTAHIEIPAVPGATPEETTRSGRMESDDIPDPEPAPSTPG